MVFATIPLLGVFCLDLGARTPRGRYAAKSKLHTFSHCSISNLKIITSNGGHRAHNSTVLVSTTASSSFVCRGQDATIPSRKSALILCSYFPFLPPRSLYPDRNPIADSNHSWHTKREVSLPFLNPTEHLCISTSVWISIQVSCGAKFVVAFHVRFDTFTMWGDRDDSVLVRQTSLLLLCVSTYDASTESMWRSENPNKNNIVIARFDGQFRSRFDILTTLLWRPSWQTHIIRSRKSSSPLQPFKMIRAMAVEVLQRNCWLHVNFLSNKLMSRSTYCNFFSTVYTTGLQPSTVFSGLLIRSWCDNVLLLLSIEDVSIL